MKTKKKRILVVDDKASDTRLLKLYLEQSGDYVVREVNDANTALSTAEEFEPHLILLDMMMPGINGTELARCFEAHPKLKGVPIVFLTVKVTKEEIDLAGGRIGRYPFLAKPIILTEVGDCLKQHLGEKMETYEY